MGQSPDQIRQEIDQKRADAAQKIDQIQSQVQDTSEQLKTQVNDTTAQVQETVQHVREQVQGTVEDSVETAKQAIENIDFQKYIQDYPLIAAGAAFFGGIVLGKVMSGGDNGGGGQQYQQSSGNYSQQSSGVGNGMRSAIQKSGLDDTISNAAAALMGQVTDQVKTTLDRSFPGFSDKLQTAQKSDGSIMDKAKAAVDPDSALR
ncbi:MAG: hypothetical protein WKF81_02120 [Thermomicrobiales bacterium]